MVFLVHTFLRPSEFKLLQNKHIEVRKYSNVDQLVISVPNAKTKVKKEIVFQPMLLVKFIKTESRKDILNKMTTCFSITNPQEMQS